MRCLTCRKNCGDKEDFCSEKCEKDTGISQGYPSNAWIARQIKITEEENEDEN